jgi:hypothetical protein
MNCSRCGFEVQSGFAFCPKCGAKQPSSCPSCGYACAPDFAYCPKCGAHIDDAPKVDNQRELSSPKIPTTIAMGAHSSALKPNPVIETERASRPPLHKVDSEANRRTITVLFADLSGFTTMSERLDPEVMQAFQNELFEELTAAVQNFGGFVDKFIGDALLALFGAPAAHEDDPERALRAALDMIKRTTCLSERSKISAGLPLM